MDETRRIKEARPPYTPTGNHDHWQLLETARQVVVLSVESLLEYIIILFLIFDVMF